MLKPFSISKLTVFIATLLSAPLNSWSAQLESIRVSDDGTHFVRSISGTKFVVWGVNYDHDGSGRLLDEYWIDEWSTVVQDFQEIKSLGANCVRIHLQVGKFLDAPDTPNHQSLAQLAKLVQLAEETSLYLDITGLACYHKHNIPTWYDQLSEAERWRAQAVFWRAVAQTCQASPAIFCYDLMNEPVLPGEKPETDWLLGELGGKYFVQRIALASNGRTREQIAQAWIEKLVDAIREQDQTHMVTVGVIPWVFVFGGGKPLFHSPSVGQRLDFAAVHFYPKAGEVDQAVKALKAYDLGKPLLVEEMFPLACSQEELAESIQRSTDFCDGYISFYWGSTADQLRGGASPSLAESITAAWLDRFRQLATTLRTQHP